MNNNVLLNLPSDVESFPLNNYVNPLFQLNTITPYWPNMADFCAEDIPLRYDLVRKLMEHTDKVLKMLLQTGSKDLSGRIFSNNRISIAMKSPMYDCLPITIGGWIDNQKNIYGTDIVSLYAYAFNKSYRAALHEICGAFNKKKSFGDHESKTKWHIQEKNSIAVDPLWGFDNFCCFFPHKLRRYIYWNEYCRLVGFVVKIYLQDDSESEIFYTIWRRHDSEEEKIVPLFPEKPYMIYNRHLLNENVTSVIFFDDEAQADDIQSKACETSINMGHESYFDHLDWQQIFEKNPLLVCSTCPGGLKNLPDADLSCLTGRAALVPLPQKFMQFEYIDALAKNCKKAGSTLKVLYAAPGQLVDDQWLDSSQILSNPEHFGLQVPAVDLRSAKGGFADVGEALPNADRQVKVLVDPIIESGTITWLFAAEKAGKTLMGLSIAYAAGKGNRPIGAWQVEDPCKVLYIDGEMPANKMTTLIDMIANGYKDTDGAKSRPYALYSFYENGMEYDNILTDEWQNEWNSRIAAYDLVILDNYYSLNENRLDVKPFIRWLKSHARNGVAFVVLDHINSEGELQGALIKRRAADLGIMLEKTSDNHVNVYYQFDRYGVESKNSPHTLVPCFIASEFRFELLNEASKEPKKLNDKLLLYSYLLTLQDKDKKTPAEIASYTKMRRSTVDNYLNAFRSTDDLSEPQKKSMPKITDEDRTLVLKEKERLMLLTDDELEERLDYLKGSSLSRLFQN